MHGSTLPTDLFFCVLIPSLVVFAQCVHTLFAEVKRRGCCLMLGFLSE